MCDSRLLLDIQAVMLDMDGVLWRGDEPFPGLEPFFDDLHDRGIPFILATNNSTKTVEAYVERLNGYGFRATADNVITSAVATAEYLRTHYPQGTRVFLVGEGGLRSIMEAAGFVPASTDVAVVVVGMDRTLTYDKLKAASYLINDGARFIGTNGDRTFPMPDGLAPGAGAVLAAVAASTGQAPYIIGKPEAYMYDLALQRLQVPAAHTLMIGDRLETDILGAQRAGLRTALVLSGVTTPEMLADSDIRPDLVFDDLRALFEAWIGVREWS